MQKKDVILSVYKPGRDKPSRTVHPIDARHAALLMDTYVSKGFDRFELSVAPLRGMRKTRSDKGVKRGTRKPAHRAPRRAAE